MDNSSIVLDDFQYSIVYGRSMYDSGLFFFFFLSIICNKNMHLYDLVCINW